MSIASDLECMVILENFLGCVPASPTLFMELCVVVSVVSRLSPRPSKEPHHRAAQTRHDPTTTPERSHLLRSNMSELRIYVWHPAGRQEKADVLLPSPAFARCCFNCAVWFIVSKRFRFLELRWDFGLLWVRSFHACLLEPNISEYIPRIWG